MHIGYDANPAILHAGQHFIVSRKATLRRCNGGGRMAFYAPDAWVVLRARRGIRACSTPANMELMAYVVALHFLHVWHGTLMSALDGNSSVHRVYIRFSLQFTILKLLYRNLIPTVLRLRAHHEV